MVFKILAGIVAAALLIVFIGPVVVKLKDAALSIVALIGVTMMLIDLWQSLQSKDD
jgi:ABC-type branched-subunit amino acid transport system permease subunit